MVAQSLRLFGDDIGHMVKDADEVPNGFNRIIQVLTLVAIILIPISGAIFGGALYIKGALTELSFKVENTATLQKSQQEHADRLDAKVTELEDNRVKVLELEVSALTRQVSELQLRRRR